MVQAIRVAAVHDQRLQGPDLASRLVVVAMMADIEAMLGFLKKTLTFKDFFVGMTENAAKVYKSTDWWFTCEEPHLCQAVLTLLCNKVQRTTRMSLTLRQWRKFSETFAQMIVLKSGKSEVEALTLAHDLISSCTTGGFRLDQLVNNSRALLPSLTKQDFAKEVKDLDLDQDIMSLHLNFKSSVRKSNLRPTGNLAPVILPVNQILQELSTTSSFYTCKQQWLWHFFVLENVNPTLLSSLCILHGRL